MRRSILLLLLLLACSPYRDIEKEGGWRGVPLGAQTEAVQGLTPISQDPDLGDAVYSRQGESARWGKARIAVRYHFFDGALWKIEITTGDSMALLDAIKGDYGTPPFSNPWTWEGEAVRMHFQGHEHDSAAEVTIVDKALEASRTPERAERLARKRAKELEESAARKKAMKEEAAARRAARAQEGAADAEGAE